MDHTSILIVSADRAGASGLARPLADHGFSVRIALNGTDALEWMVQGSFNAVVLDTELPDLDPFQILEEIQLKRLPIAVLVAVRDQALSGLPDPLPSGILDIVRIPADLAALPTQLRGALQSHAVRSQNKLLARNVRRGSDLRGLITTGQPMDRIARTIRRLANSQSSVLILGESGTGRQRIARAIHETSVVDGPLLSVPCGALPEFLLDLELFGHPKSQLDFDGACGPGALQEARGGTLLLTDIDCMPLRIQTKLISSLSPEREALSSKCKDKTRSERVRFLSTASPDLLDRSQKGTFKKELLEALSGVTLEVPSLKDRSRPHLAKLIKHFESRIAQAGELVTPLPKSELVRLVNHCWPGNLTELRQAIELYVRSVPGEADAGNSLHDSVNPHERLLTDFDPNEPLADIVKRLTQSIEKAYLCQVLAAHGGRIDRTAAHLGLNRKSIGTKVKQHGIDKERFKAKNVAQLSNTNSHSV